jgi:NADPH:quinone reductase
MPKIVRFHQTGGAEVLQLEELATPVPQKDEVRIRVEAIGLNRAEIMFRQGAYLEQPQFPSLLGYEAAGVVEEIGPGVTDFKPGDRVSSIPSFSMTRYGTYGEVAVLPAYALAKYPSRLSPVEATAIWMQYLTAYGLVEFGHLHEGDQLLITAAASSVGLAAIQIANALGATPMATTRNPAKEKALREAGARQVINTGLNQWVNQVNEVTGGKGVDLAFDPVAGPALELIAQTVREEGIIFV